MFRLEYIDIYTKLKKKIFQRPINSELTEKNENKNFGNFSFSLII